MRIRFVTPTIFLYFFSWFSQAQDRYEINYTIDDGLPSNTVYCMAQDDRGFIWFGTDSGLSRFDGYEFINYSLEDGLPDSEILNFFKDSQSRIWFYTYNGKVGFVKDDSIYTSANMPWMKTLDYNNRITSIIEHDEYMYFSAVHATIKSLHKKKAKSLDIKLGKNSDYSFYLSEGKVRAIGYDEIITLNHGKPVKRERRDITSAVTYPIYLNDVAYGFYRGFSNNGITRIDSNKTLFKQFGSSDRILNLQKVGQAVIVLTESGVFELDPITITLKKKIKAISNATSMLIDMEKNTWYTSITEGVFMSSETQLTRISDLKDVTTLKSGSNRLYIGHSGRNLSSYDSKNGLVDLYQLKGMNHIRNIIIDDEDSVWVSRYDAIFKGQRNFTNIGSHVVSIQSDQIYLGRRNGLYQLGLNNSDLNHVFDSASVLDILHLAKDSILLGSDNGILVYSKNGIKKLSDNPLFNVRVHKMAFTKTGELWIATGGNGLLRLNKAGDITQVTQLNGLSSNVCTDLLMQDSHLWALTTGGLNKIILDGETTMIYNALSGHNSYQIEDIEVFNDSLFLASSIGLFAFPKNLDLVEDNDLKVFIDKVQTSEGIISKNEFKYPFPSTQIVFKALTYKSHNNLKYRYQLTSTGSQLSQNDWISSKYNAVTFSELNPGDYTFWVAAMTTNSSWSEPIKYRFVVHPAFWQKTTIQIGAVFILLLFGFLSVRSYYKRQSSKKGLERDKISSEVKALKAQINPHFIFNSLNSIQSFLLDGDIDHADEYLIKYGKLIRMVLDFSDKLTVPLATELELLSLYVSLEQLRFEESFEFNIRIDENINPESVRIPSMILQPLIENAIWHGISPLENKGIINLTMTNGQHFCEIVIEDNGVGFDATILKGNKPHISKGSRLVSERLQLISQIEGSGSSLNIESTLDKGTRAKLTFPVKFD